MFSNEIVHTHANDDDTLYNVSAPSGEVLFTARLIHIAFILRLQDAAVERIKHETSTGTGICTLHMNGRNSPWLEPHYLVEETE